MKKIIKTSILLTLIMFIITTSVIYLIPAPIIDKYSYIEFYDNENNLIYTYLNSYESTYIRLEELNEYTYNAFIAIEDDDFYEHSGFDIKRNIHSAIINIFSGSIKQGASTISQQYARNVLLNNERTISRKIKEAFYTIQIEKEYSKKKILEGYLNSLYFGHGLIGINAASYYYFNKHPSSLSIAESAMLAGLCNAPSIYSPKISTENATKRKNLVLYKMLIEDFITPQDYQTALKESLTFNFNKKIKTNLNYYIDAAISELKENNVLTKRNLQKGLKVYLNIDYSLTNEINSIISKHQSSNIDNQLGIIILEPNSNKIVYLSGGFDYSTSPYNRVIHSSRQIGSTIKPLLYYLALKNDFSPNTLLTSEETTFNIKGIGEYSPKNANNTYANEQIDMIQAIALSDNIYALKTLLLIGSENLIKLLSAFNINKIEKVPSIALGTVNTSLLKLTNIYNTFASAGKQYNPSFINKVEDSRGNKIYHSNNNFVKTLDESATLILNQMLTSTFDKSLSSYANATMSNYKANNIYAAKSGSTSSDSYVIAYNPNYTIGIWTGKDSNKTITNHTLSKQLFEEIAAVLDTKKEQRWYSTNYHTTALKYNPVTHSFDDSGKWYFFKK